MNGEASQRLFIAIDLPVPHREILGALQVPIRGVAWTPPEQLHLTLRFLGDADRETRTALTAKLSHISVEPFILPLAGLGVFPPRETPKIIWAGVGHGHPRLFQLRQQIDDTLLATGMDLDLRTFVAHITLARCGRAGKPQVAAFLKQNQAFEGPPFKVERFILYSSRLTPDGAIHQVEDEFRLCG
ncbi:MAG: RNA 2',3'-cyclic phosphodiesterase [Opitutaceae bacterium]